MPDLEMVLFSSCLFTLRRLLFPSFFPSVFLSFIFSFLGHKWKMKRDGIVLLSCNILSHRPFVLILSFSLFLSLHHFIFPYININSGPFLLSFSHSKLLIFTPPTAALQLFTHWFFFLAFCHSQILSSFPSWCWNGYIGKQWMYDGLSRKLIFQMNDTIFTAT